MHIVLEAAGDGGVRATGLDESDEPRFTEEFPRGRLPEWVAAHADGPRWVWDDTARWYPRLLDAGVRVERCTDLRLCHAVLRRALATARSRLATAEPNGWDRLETQGPDDGGLFRIGDETAQLDAVAEFRLQREAVAQADGGRLGLLLAAESAGALIAAELTFAGVPWRADVHDRILTGMLGPRPAPGMRPARLAELLGELRERFGSPDLNPDSPPELLRGLRRAGISVSSTRSWELKRVEHPGIPALLEYKKLSRLASANGWQWLDSWVRDGRFTPVYVPGGVVTGRWASNGGGALQLPAQVRDAVRADDGWKLIVADAAQLEPRVLAGLSGDLAMARAAQGADLYSGMVESGAVQTREQAKYGMLGAMYGGTRGESGRMVPRLGKAYPRALGLVEAAARAGERGESVSSLLGRSSPRPGTTWPALGDVDDQAEADERERRARSDNRAWGRFTRNFVVQSTAAEWALCWMAALRNRLWTLGSGTLRERPHLAFFLHDEVLVHSPAGLADEVAEHVRQTAAEAGRLLFGAFPIEFPVTVSVVDSYADAK
ncbi:bifunctional 3'-5' exonuclease/DNA polymerase [Lysobacter korlensis]|uniref:DNA-directed DNA polymerase n=1 Tax=Lysobacter korlensis TaxID=553636 RepID=A0ABV6RNM0_9GAMM